MGQCLYVYMTIVTLVNTFQLINVGHTKQPKMKMLNVDSYIYVYNMPTYMQVLMHSTAPQHSSIGFVSSNPWCS